MAGRRRRAKRENQSPRCWANERTDWLNATGKGSSTRTTTSSWRWAEVSSRAMDPDRLKALLTEVSSGQRSIDEAVRELRDLPFRDLGFARADTHRHLRTGFPEVV